MYLAFDGVMSYGTEFLNNVMTRVSTQAKKLGINE